MVILETIFPRDPNWDPFLPGKFKTPEAALTYYFGEGALGQEKRGADTPLLTFSPYQWPAATVVSRETGVRAHPLVGLRVKGYPTDLPFAAMEALYIDGIRGLVGSCKEGLLGGARNKFFLEANRLIGPGVLGFCPYGPVYAAWGPSGRVIGFRIIRAYEMVQLFWRCNSAQVVLDTLTGSNLSDLAGRFVSKESIGLEGFVCGADPYDPHKWPVSLDPPPDGSRVSLRPPSEDEGPYGDL